jgi:ribose transport system ATP-binding protein
LSAAPGIPRLSIRRLSKTFGRVRVLSEVDLDVAPGEIHGLVGQNGSGKSTLIKLLSGFYRADAGAEIQIDGVPLGLPIAPAELQRCGLAFVHQNLGLDADASVIENVRIGRFMVGRFTRRIKWREEAASVWATLESLGAGDIDPFASVSSLNHGQRASVAIARAIQGIEPGGGCIVFDESTQSLPREILHEFYGTVRALAASGTSVIMVSHRLDEVLALCDRVTVLEDGVATVSGHPTAGLTEADLTKLILGSSHAQKGLSSVARRVERAFFESGFAVEGIRGGAVDGVSIDVGRGEIVGVIGNAESGYDELPYLVAGARTPQSGSLTVRGQRLSGARINPATVARAGVAFVPGERVKEGIATDLLAYENLSLPRLGRKASPFLLRRRWQLDEFVQAVLALGVTPASPDLRTGSFSGGNQQKILMAKWLLNDPAVLIVHEPTQAVDVGARDDILTALRTRADAGLSVVISSLEADDLAAVCDRIVVMKAGRIHRELTGAEIAPHTIVDCVYAGITSEIEHVAA